MKKFSLLILSALTLAFVSCKDASTSSSAKTESATNADTAPTAEQATGQPSTDLSVTPNATSTPAPADAATPQTGTTANVSPEPSIAKPVGPITSVSFDKLEYDYGTIKDGTKVTHNFKFKNTGKEPLIISDAKGSCGCTVPDWPREPIAPGKTGEIKVVFDSKDKGTPEGTPNSKRVTITANTDPAQTYLTIKGIVKK